MKRNGVICILMFFFMLFSAHAEETYYLDRAEVISQQIALIKNRLAQEKNEYTLLAQRQEKHLAKLSSDHVSKQSLTFANLDVTVAKSNLDSIDIELSESQQTISRIEKESQEITNQINAYNIFGLKIARNGAPNPASLQADLAYQKKLLSLEKERLTYLVELRKVALDMLQLHSTRWGRIQQLLKSQTMTQLKQQQAKSEIHFQQQQADWLNRLNELHNQLIQLERSSTKDKAAYIQLENQIFYANENVNFTYLQMLVSRYQDQMSELKVSISRTGSIALLNKVNEQAQALGKQFSRLNQLLKARINILEKRVAFLQEEKRVAHDFVVQVSHLEDQYKTTQVLLSDLDNELVVFHTAIDQALQQELSSRQGLPGLGAKAWLDLGNELFLVPTLTFQVIKSLAHTIIRGLRAGGITWWVWVGLFETVWFAALFLMKNRLGNWLSGMADHEFGHINLKWLGIKLVSRSLTDIAVIGGGLWLFLFCGIPVQSLSLLVNMGLVWLLFRSIITVARICLLETVHDRKGHDVLLYYRLKWSFLVGGVVTAFTVFMYQLPVIYEIKDLFARFFLLFLLMVSVFLLKSWDILPGLILPHIDDRRTYFRRVIKLFGLLIPSILLINSAIGLFGYVNFVLTVSWYEGIFLLVLVFYLLVRGFLTDGMEHMSYLLIRHVSNGWLWTEAFLKPIDKVLRVLLFFIAWVVLFLLYGWGQQSPVVERLMRLVHYPLFHLSTTVITVLNLIELAFVVSLLYWAARWTREFVYRLLLSRTEDLGIRNSVAILSQYTVIVVSVIICMRVLGIDYQALTAVVGLFAIGVGFGLRDLFNNFACGFLLLIERPLRVGDTVCISNYEGEVIHIGSRAVTMRTWDHMEVLVPNAEIFSKSFINWTAKDNVVRTVIAIKCHRQDNPANVQRLILEVLGDHKNILKDPTPEVLLKELTDGLIELEVRYFINLRQVRSRIGVRSDVLLCIWQAFEKHGIHPPYPHREIHINGSLPAGK